MPTAHPYDDQIAECRRLAASTTDLMAKAAYEAMAAEFVAKSDTRAAISSDALSTPDQRCQVGG